MSEESKLFSEFTPISTEEWESKIIEDLKGADYKKKLIWNSNEEIEIKPYYRVENLLHLDYLNTIPGQYPYSRGNNADKNHWLIRQNIIVDNVNNANNKALDILNKGVNSILFELTNSFHTKTIRILLKDICCDCIELNFKANENSNELLKEYTLILKNNHTKLQEVNGTLGYDPIGNLALKGNFYFHDEKKSINQLKEIFHNAKDLPKLRLITVNGKHFHNAGGNIVQELAFTLSLGNEYLAKLTEIGFSIDEIAPKIDFNYAVGSNYFFEIAKFRAARMLWSTIVNAYKPANIESCKTTIHAETSKWNKTLLDPHVNILRSATEAMSAILGGINSFTTHPFNSSYETPTEFSERIARNQQLILNEEAYFSTIKDPSAGSYYIENLTNEIAEKAWKLFKEIENEGGFIKAFMNGIIQTQIKKTAHKRDLAIANRKEILLGINQYPNLSEKIISAPIQDSEIYKTSIAEPLKIYKGSTPFEEIRLKTEAYSKNNKRPVVFLLSFGNLAMRSARAQFSTNFFGCAGFKIMDNNGFKSVIEGIKAAKKSNADIIVFCSSDDEYNLITHEINELVNKKILVIAGNPTTLIENLYSIGITNFIHIKSNILEELKKYQDLLNI